MSILDQFKQPYDTLNRIEVSRSAVLHNFDVVAGQTGSIIPVLKANAYGHGLTQVAKILNERKPAFIAVDGYFEALTIKKVTKAPLLVMGYIKPGNYAHMDLSTATFVVHDLETIDAIGAIGQSANVHLEINTGMNRNGIQPNDLEHFLEELTKYGNIKVTGVMSHLADADGEADDYTAQQVQMFDAAVEQVRAAGFDPATIHLAQTAGSQRVSSKYANAVRLGIGLYGINPFGTSSTHGNKLAVLKPALQLISTVSKVIDVPAGEKISYNGIFTTKRQSRIGVLPLGYYEGVRRALSNKGVVTSGGQQAPIVGRVCMNHTMVDLTDTKLSYGDEVIVISNDPTKANSIAGIAAEIDMLTYEILTSLSSSVRRVVVD